MTTNTRAARAVAILVPDRTEARHFLDMLGLVDEDNRITPDDTRAGSNQGTGHRPVIRETLHTNDKPKYSTAPESLRVLPPVVKAAAIPAAKKVKSVAEGRKTRAGSGRKRAECGTTSGYKRHQREKTEFCEPCRTAAKIERNARRKPYVRKGRETVTQPCGTNAAFHRHRARQEPVCEPCRLAHNAMQREADRKRAAAQGRPFEPKSTDPVTCGTTRGHYWHRQRGEAPCAPCATARYEQRKATKGQQENAA